MAKITEVWDFLKQNNEWVGIGNDVITIGKAVKSIVETLLSNDPFSDESKQKYKDASEELFSLLPNEAGLTLSADIFKKTVNDWVNGDARYFEVIQDFGGLIVAIGDSMQKPTNSTGLRVEVAGIVIEAYGDLLEGVNGVGEEMDIYAWWQSVTQTDAKAEAMLYVESLSRGLDKTVAQEKINTFIDVSKNNNVGIQESVAYLNHFRKLLGMTGEVTPATSEAVYQEVTTVLNTPVYQSLKDKVTLVAPPLSASEARSDLGLFLSLYYLTPFALKTDGSIAADAQLTIAHPDLATQFKEDKLLTPEQRANGEANFSDMYLADRAAMLGWLNKRNLNDTSENIILNSSFNQLFEDKVSQTLILTGSAIVADADRRQFRFGSSDTDTLTGGDKDDHLYGMGGTDTLNGGKGNDRLEGGSGADILNGGEGRDTLYGGTEADTLKGEDGVDHLYGGTGNDNIEGGKEADYLFGGAGTDTYIHNDGDGNDVIQDSDGLGRIQIKTGVILDGGQKVTNSSYVWESADHKTRYTQYDQGDGKYTLNILLANGEKLYVKDWQDGDLGISLQGATPQDPPPSGTTITENSDMVFASDANEQIDSGGGNDILIATAREKLTLNGGAGDDMILGHGNWYTSSLYDSDNTKRVNLAPSSSSDHASSEWRDIQGDWQYDLSTYSSLVNYIPAGENLGSLWMLTGTDSQYGAVSSQTNGVHNNLYTYAYSLDFSIPNEEITETLLGGAGNDLISGSFDADYIDGGDDNDVLYGNSGNDFVFGGQGQDFADGGDGNDYIDGGTENDVLVGGYGDDVIHGGTGDDQITGDLLPLAGTDPKAPPPSTDFSLMGNDYLDGGIGNDSIWGGAGADMILGGDGDDVLYGDGISTPEQYEGDDILEGGAGNDEIHGDGGNDSIDGGTGADILWGDAGNDYLNGGEGDDQLLGGAGNDVLIGTSGDTLQGGQDDDTYYIQGGSQIADLEGRSTIYIANARNVSTTTQPTVNPDNQNLNITLDNGEVLSIQAALYGMDASLQFAGGEAVDVETLVSTQLTDSVNLFLSSVILASGATVNHAFGGKGNDQIVGDIADDTLKGYAGNDTLFGGNGNDVISGGEGNDHTQGDAGNDVIDGGAGVDEVQGGAGDDLLNGGADDDRLFGQEGSDTLDGGSGNDVLVGNAGDDVYLFNLGGGRDVVWEEGDTAGDVLRFGADIAASDIVVYKSGFDLVLSHVNGLDQITIANWYGSPTYQLQQFEFADGTIWSGIDTGNLGWLRGTAGDDVIYGTSQNETLYGMDGNDTLYGNGGQDTLIGGAGNDRLNGSLGGDALYGDAGNDTLVGNGGADLLVGGMGNDNITGSYGFADTYVFALGDGADIINASDNLARDTLRFAADIQSTDISAERVGNNLVLRHQNGTDSVTFTNWYLLSGNNYKLANVIFDADGVTWDTNTLSEMWANISHNYTLNIGDGAKTIEDWGGSDTLTIGNAINDSDILISRVGQNLQLNHVNGIDSVTIKDWFNDVNKQIETITFAASGTTFTKEQITLNYLTLTGTNGQDVIYGSDLYGETILGMAGNDTLYGGAGDDVLNGAGDNDILYGGAGNDYLDSGTGTANVLHGEDGNDTLVGVSEGYGNTLNGGMGNDTYIYSSASATYNGTLHVFDTGGEYDQIIFGEGINMFSLDFRALGKTLDIHVGLTYLQIDNHFLGTQYEVERLVFADGNSVGLGDVQFDSSGGGVINGTAEDSILFSVYSVGTLNGGDGNDWLRLGYTQNGGNGDDWLQYGTIQNGDAGNDWLNGVSMTGGTGNDFYVVDDRYDTVVELANEGIDTVSSTIAYALGTNIENLILSGAASINGTGNALDNIITGNAAGNTLTGGAGNDWIDGKDGSDKMIGGTGDDIYVVETSGETITERSNEGTDTVLSSVTITLATNLENLTLTGSANINGTGNSLANTITGNEAANHLNGGSGADTLVGGLGNDVYTVDMLTDSVTENLNEGIDLVNIAIATKSGTYTLGNNIENATITSTVAYNVTGNALDNVLIGNAAANILTGGAGNDTLDGAAGADNLVGGTGDDVYIIDVATDVITEAVGAGNDTVKSAVTYTLGATSNLENIILTGTTAINATGNAYANLLMGNAANNVLTDTAGGNDILQGLAGIDTFNDTVGNNLFDGGLGNDLFTAGAGNDVIIGGQGNDTITTGTGYDVIVFNKGDGQDIINASTGADNTISLGGNFAYSDLSLTKTGNDLILKMGSTDQITFKDWYVGTTNHSVVNLQVIAEAMAGFNLSGSDVLRDNNVENFNFANIVATFDAAGATANWQLTDTLLTDHLQAGSDSAAIGGDLAYQYGKDSNLTGMGLFNAQSVIGAASFGQVAQALNNPTAWQAEVVKLG